jgi:hypothetical protein
MLVSLGAFCVLFIVISNFPHRVLATPSFAVFLSFGVVFASGFYTTLVAQADFNVMSFLEVEQMLEAKKTNAPGFLITFDACGLLARFDVVYTGKRRCIVRDMEVTLQRRPGEPDLLIAVDADVEWFPEKRLMVPARDEWGFLLTLLELADYRLAMLTVEADDDEEGRRTFTASVPDLDLLARQELARVKMSSAALPSFGCGRTLDVLLEEAFPWPSSSHGGGADGWSSGRRQPNGS